MGLQALQRRRGPRAQWPALGSWQQLINNNHGSGSSLNYEGSCWRTPGRPALQHVHSHSASEANWNMEELGKWVSRERTEETCHLKCCLLFCATTMNRFLTALWHETKSGFYKAGDDQLSGWTNKLQTLPKARHYQKSHGHCSRVWPTAAFWTLVKPLHPRSTLSKSMRCSENRQRLQAALLTEGPSSPPRGATLDHMPHNRHFKRWTNWATKFCPICHIRLTSHQPTATSPSVPTKFCRENASTTSRRQKMLSKSSANPEAWIFMQQEQTYFSLAKMCWF